jgi:peptide/nickel transport system substrate-binding protein
MNLSRKFATLAVTAAMFTGVLISTPGVAGAASGTLTIDNEQGLLWPCTFNPLTPTDTPFSFGPIYEPLMFVDTLNNAKVSPWLAKSDVWSNNNKTLTFTTQSGVTWSDGKPFSAADVAFTFNLLKKDPALDLNSVWSVLSSVTATSAHSVQFNFKTSAVPYFFYIADQTPILPQHIWSTLPNPVSYPDKNPVGTGAYTMGQCNPQNMKYTANPHYWQAGLPKIATVNYPAFLTNNTANEYLSAGNAQWGNQFIPNIQSGWLSKSPYNKVWFPPFANWTVFPNLTYAPLKSALVRQAISLAIDRARVTKIGEYGIEQPSNQTGVVTPTFASWQNTAALKAYGSSYNPTKAKALLKQAGYGVGGKTLSLSIIVIGGYSDSVADCQIMATELKAIGINLTVDPLASATFNADLFTGKYQLAYNFESGGPSPFYELRQLLYSKNSAPIGQSAASNWERFNSPAADALFAQYGATTSTATYHSIVNKLQQLMLTTVPVIPIAEYVDFDQYNTKSIGGWPTPQNPFAQPAAYVTPDFGQMLLHLYPKG